jgi:hypothetical protein
MADDIKATEHGGEIVTPSPTQAENDAAKVTAQNQAAPDDDDDEDDDVKKSAKAKADADAKAKADAEAAKSKAAAEPYPNRAMKSSSDK